MTSEKSSNQRSTGIPKWLVIVWLVVALAGFVDATYLTIKHYQGDGITCSLTGDCGEVLTSEYSEVFGMPVALGGAVYYLFMLLGAVSYLDKENDQVFRWFAYFSWAGLLASVWFLYLQAYVIQAFCQYCLLSAGTSTLLFVMGMTVLYKYKNIETIQDERE